MQRDLWGRQSVKWAIQHHGAHTEPSWWINKGVLPSEGANFLTFGIINNSLPLEKKPAVPAFFWDTSKAFSTTNKLIIWQAKCQEKWKQISPSKALNILVILYLFFKCYFLFVWSQVWVKILFKISCLVHVHFLNLKDVHSFLLCQPKQTQHRNAYAHQEQSLSSSHF